ncbi:LysR family transcriptional regulator [Xylophilus sp. GW821-FHT01B05]
MQIIRNSLANLLNLEQLRSFVLVVETGSFSVAAERLGLTQPAVSLQVKQLERRLAVRLVERVGKRAGATVAGAELLRQAQHIEAALESALDAVASHAAGVTGRVRLGCGATACLHFLPPVLRALRLQYPALSIAVSTGNTDECARKVEDNLLDLALVTLPVAGRSLLATPILQDEFVAIRRDGASALKGGVTPAALQAQPLVLFEPGASTRRLIDRWFAAGDCMPQPVMELGSVEAIKEMVAAGLGYSIVPRMALTGRSAHPELQSLPLRPRLGRTLALVMRRDKPVSRGMRLLADAIAQAGDQARQAGAPPLPA